MNIISKRRFNIQKRSIALMIVSALIVTLLSVTAPYLEVRADDKYPIMGPSNITIGKLIEYYNHYAKYPSFYSEVGSDAPTIDDFCRIYVEECAAENVRVEVAFTQAMKETGYLRFGGAVDIAAFNFAGIGSVDSSPGSYNWFVDVRTGIRAQVQHLKAYASTEPLNNPCVDPRFHLVTRGIAPYVEDLGGRWASGSDYGYSIRNDYMERLDHFTGFVTMYQGVEYNMVYDPEYYLKTYPDLRGYANDGYALLEHFVRYGINEARQASDYFSAYVYRANYVDLRNAFGYNMPAYINHYIHEGVHEGRHGLIIIDSDAKAWVLNGVDYSSVYDYNFYTAANPDIAQVIGGDDLDILTHFVNNGMVEGRVSSDRFDYRSYMNEYPDLRAAFRYDIKSYYMHYLNFGRAEGRHGTGCDHRVGAITRAWIFEMQDVYNFDYYIANNPDVAAVVGDDDIAALDHFLMYGMNEGRRASGNFDVWAYAGNNLDLLDAFGWDMAKYYIHYINYGRSEGRNAL